MKTVRPGISILSLALAIVIFTAVTETGSMSFGKHLRMYANSSSLQPVLSSNAQSGLRGVMNGMEKLQEYDAAARTRKVLLPGEENIAGAGAVNRNQHDRSVISSYASDAGEIGYDALLQIQKNQLPYDEYYTLLQIVEAEATGGDLASKMMIANVVLNRVKDPRFPDTISEVVWQNEGGSAQFSPTADGRIYSCTITSSTVEAVRRALDGENNAKNALFFVARSSADAHNVKWFDSSLVKLFEHGGHEFYSFREESQTEETQIQE